MKRCDGDSKKPNEFAWVVAPESFGDIASRGPRRLADLIAEFAIPGGCWLCDKGKHFLLEFTRELPGHEIFESADTHAEV